MIDAHQHFWTLARDDYGWLSKDDPVLYRDFGPADLAPHLAQAGIAGSVLVQAAPTEDETRYLLSIAERTPWVRAVVGWVDLADPRVGDALDRLGEHAAFRGVRPMLQDLPDDAWILDDAPARGLRALEARGLGFDALVRPQHLPHLLRLLERHPELAVVVDHGAKPGIASGDFDAWARDIERIASGSRACCKLSGLVTEAATDWKLDDLRRWFEHLLACFGPGRLMWGSDWPVVDLAGGFERWRDATLELLGSLDAPARQAILGGTAADFYRIGTE